MAADKRKAGKARTEPQRAARHKRLHPGTKVPVRGTGLKKKK